MSFDQIKNSKFIISCFYDGHVLYVIEEKNGGVNVSLLDVDNGEVFDEWNISVSVNKKAITAFDSNFLYMPIIGGQIIVFDKFSSQIHKIIDVGQMEIVDGVFINNEKIYCACTVPIKTQKLNIDNFCFVSYSLDGTKLFQSQLFKGVFSGLSVNNDMFFISMPFLYKITENGKKENKKLISDNYFRPIVTDNFVCCCSKHGTMEIFKKNNLETYNKILVSPSLFEPKALKDCIFWKNNTNTNKIDLNSLSVNVEKDFDGFCEGINNVLHIKS